MSEFSNRDVHRGDGVSITGIAIAVVIILAFIVVISMLGGGAPSDPSASAGAPTSDVTLPAASPSAPAVPAD